MSKHTRIARLERRRHGRPGRPVAVQLVSEGESIPDRPGRLIVVIRENIVVPGAAATVIPTHSTQ